MAIKIVLYQRTCGYNDSCFISEDGGGGGVKIAVLYQRMCGYNDSRFISEDVWLQR